MSKKDRVHNLKVIIDNHSTKQVKNFRHLGSIISQEGKSTMNVRSRIAQVKTALINKRNLLCSKNTSIRVNKRLIKVYVWSAVLYGYEPWVLNKTSSKVSRCGAKEEVSWTDRKTNECILCETDETRKLLNTITERRMNMIGHVLRHEEELRYTVMEG